MPNGTKSSAKGRRRGRPRQFDESEVLDTITEVFWRRGFAGTSLDALSSATGIARPSLYATFGDKEAMYLAGLRNYFDRIDAAMGSVVQRTAPLDDVLRDIFDVLIEQYTGGSDGARGCLIVCTATTEAPTNERVQEALGRVLADIDARFERVLEGAKQRGELEPGKDVSALATVLAGVTHTLAVRARAGADPAQLQAIAAAAITLVNPK